MTDLLASLGAATLGEAGAHALAPRVRAAWAGATVAGPAVTARCSAGDNLAVHAAVASAPSGYVLVVEVPDDRVRGFWGEVLTTAALARGIRGLVIDASVRDTAAVAARGFPVFSTGVALPGATKHGPGAIGVPVQVGGASVHPGDWVVGDGDGVVVVPAAELEAVTTAALERQQAEEELFQRLEGGATTVELLELDESTIERGPGDGDVKVTRILHHSVNVHGDLDEARTFYATLLGLDPAERPDIPGVAGAWFTVADAQVHLVDADAGDGAIRPTAAHVCLGVEDIDGAIAELEAAGIAYVRGAEGPVVQVWVTDPSGNVVELQQDPEPRGAPGSERPRGPATGRSPR